jgi:hypothetical protein
MKQTPAGIVSGFADAACQIEIQFHSGLPKALELIFGDLGSLHVKANCPMVWTYAGELFEGGDEPGYGDSVRCTTIRFQDVFHAAGINRPRR